MSDHPAASFAQADRWIEGEVLTVRQNGVHPAVWLSLRRKLLGLSVIAAAELSGLPVNSVRKAHSPLIRTYPFMTKAREEIAALYGRLEAERGYRPAR
jgi:hypothetical protein